jgi:hypothetical protein
VALSLLAALALVLPSSLSARSHQPPSEPHTQWGAISTNLEGFEYPHLVRSLAATEPVR